LLSVEAVPALHQSLLEFAQQVHCIVAAHFDADFLERTASERDTKAQGHSIIAAECPHLLSQWQVKRVFRLLASTRPSDSPFADCYAAALSNPRLIQRQMLNKRIQVEQGG
jgi:hypothetical protein